MYDIDNTLIIVAKVFLFIMKNKKRGINFERQNIDEGNNRAKKAQRFL